MKKKKSLLSVVIVAVAIAIGSYYGIDVSSLFETESVSEQEQFKVVKVIDGDTIKINYKGEEENIRFLLIDTPELRHKDFDGPQPYALEAKERVEHLLRKGTVDIEIGVQERDKYGRLLGYLYVDGKNIQEELLRDGLARVAYVYNDKRLLERFLAAEEEAKRAKKGIWSIDNYVTDKGFVNVK